MIDRLINKWRQHKRPKVHELSEKRVSFKTEYQVILKRYPQHSELIWSIFESFPEEYLTVFDRGQIENHIKKIISFHKREEVSVEYIKSSEESKVLYYEIVAPNFRGILSMICGSIYLCEGNIINADIYVRQPEQERDYSVHHGVFRIGLELPKNIAPEGMERRLLSRLGQSLRRVFSKEGIFNKRVEAEFNDIYFLVSSQLVTKNRPKGILEPPRVNYNIVDNQIMLNIESYDAPGFLFAFCHVLSLRGYEILKTHITTKGKKIENQFIMNHSNPSYYQQNKIASIIYSITVLNQFFYLLPSVGDKNSAIEQIRNFLIDLKVESIQNPCPLEVASNEALGLLAQAFGVSHNFWNGFIRKNQVLLATVIRNKFQGVEEESLDEVKAKVKQISKLVDIEEQAQKFTDIKNEYLFKLDIRYLAERKITFLKYSSKLSTFAEKCIQMAFIMVYNHLNEKERVLLDTIPHVLVALGKLATKEIGFASDLDIMFIYSLKEESYEVKNILNKFIQSFASILSSHSEQWKVDFSLRPYPSSSPLAVSENQIKNYYVAKGNTCISPYEFLAVEKSRLLLGNKKFYEEIINHINQEAQKVPLRDIVESANKLLQKQCQERPQPHLKYSEGGIQALQITISFLRHIFAPQIPGILSMSILDSLIVLKEQGILSEYDFAVVVSVYIFQRELANAVRVTIGLSKELTLPNQNSYSYELVARNIGYSLTDTEKLKERLAKDVEFFNGLVKVFHHNVTKRLKKEERPERLSPIFGESFTDMYPELSLCIRDITSKFDSPYLLVLIFHILRTEEDFPNLRNLMTKVEHIFSLLSEMESAKNMFRLFVHARETEFIITLLKTSQVFSNFLVHDLKNIHSYITSISHPTSRNEHLYKLNLLKEISGHNIDFLAQRIQRYSNLVIIRIFLREYLLRIPISQTTHELSNLYVCHVRIIYESLCSIKKLELAKVPTIIALGKVGSGEVNYASDIDIMCVTQENYNQDYKYSLATLVRDLLEVYNKSNSGCFVPKLDTDLTPQSQERTPIISLEDIIGYYSFLPESQLHELLYWCRSRVISGDDKVHQNIVEHIIDIINRIPDKMEIIKSSLVLLEKQRKEEANNRNIKLRVGGTRWVELLVIFLTLQYSTRELFTQRGNISSCIELLREETLISIKDINTIEENYNFLRRLEHLLQVQDMKKNYLIPLDNEYQEVLAYNVGLDSYKKLEDKLNRVCKKNEELLEKYNKLQFHIKEQEEELIK